MQCKNSACSDRQRVTTRADRLLCECLLSIGISLSFLPDHLEIRPVRAHLADGNSEAGEGKWLPGSPGQLAAGRTWNTSNPDSNPTLLRAITPQLRHFIIFIGIHSIWRLNKILFTLIPSRSRIDGQDRGGGVLIPFSFFFIDS